VLAASAEAGKLPEADLRRPYQVEHSRDALVARTPVRIVAAGGGEDYLRNGLLATRRANKPSYRDSTGWPMLDVWNAAKRALS